MPFEILFEDSFYVAINKPPGILVHKTGMSQDTVFVLQLLRDQLKQRIYPVHRLDRATSGVLIFGKNQEAARFLGMRFQEKQVEKKYRAVVRGYVPEHETIDYPLADAELGQAAQPAVTRYWRLGQSEMPLAIGARYPTARFSLLEVIPETGRRQQIRKHFAHIFHPIIGDRRHGDHPHNCYFRDVLNLDRMLLHAHSLEFDHPELNQTIHIQAAPDDAFWFGLDLTGLRAFWRA
ncbi:MAG: pseudouridylate synthase [Bacteroidetes bacterium]|nr:pseudouridylate synthase [Bacteroidota bacterium]